MCVLVFCISFAFQAKFCDRSLRMEWTLLTVQTCLWTLQTVLAGTAGTVSFILLKPKININPNPKVIV